MYRGFTIVLFYCFYGVTAFSQVHNNSWFRTSFEFRWNEKWGFENEVQYRRQHGYDNKNPFDHHLLTSYRSWIHYKKHPQLKFSLSPFAYFQSSAIVQNSTDEDKPLIHELRFSGALNANSSSSKKLVLRYRTGLEIRNLIGQQFTVVRFRNKIGCQYPLSAKTTVSLSDELLINIAANRAFQVFDQNRLGIDLKINCSKTITLEVGYLFTVRLLQNTAEQRLENNFYLNLLFVW